MKVELIPQHGELLIAYCDLFLLPTNMLCLDKEDFFTIWKHFDSLQITGENARHTEQLNLSFTSHRARISGQLSGYDIGLVEFAKCWEALGWAVAWFLQARGLTVIPNN